MKKMNMVVYALLVIFSVTMSAGAFADKSISRQDGLSAYAGWIETNPSGLTNDTFISVTRSNDGTDVYLSLCSYDQTGGYLSCKSGYTFTQENVFNMDKKLDSADINAVEIDLYEWSCDETGLCQEIPAGAVTLKANWTGIGDVSKGSYKSMSRSGDFVSKYDESTSMRDATVTGSINGIDLGASSYGNMFAFKYVSMWMQK